MLNRRVFSTTPHINLIFVSGPISGNHFSPYCRDQNTAKQYFSTHLHLVDFSFTFLLPLHLSSLRPVAQSDAAQSFAQQCQRALEEKDAELRLSLIARAELDAQLSQRDRAVSAAQVSYHLSNRSFLVMSSDSIIIFVFYAH